MSADQLASNPLGCNNFTSCGSLTHCQNCCFANFVPFFIYPRAFRVMPDFAAFFCRRCTGSASDATRQPGDCKPTSSRPDSGGSSSSGTALCRGMGTSYRQPCRLELPGEWCHLCGSDAGGSRHRRKLIHPAQQT